VLWDSQYTVCVVAPPGISGAWCLLLLLLLSWVKLSDDGSLSPVPL
jgi:hypothetical protein